MYLLERLRLFFIELLTRISQSHAAYSLFNPSCQLNLSPLQQRCFPNKGFMCVPQTQTVMLLLIVSFCGGRTVSSSLCLPLMIIIIVVLIDVINFIKLSKSKIQELCCKRSEAVKRGFLTFHECFCYKSI